MGNHRDYDRPVSMIKAGKGQPRHRAAEDDPTGPIVLQSLSS